MINLKTALVFLFVISSVEVSFAQKVTQPIGSTGEVHQLDQWGDKIVITSPGQIGIPGKNFDKIDLRTGEIIPSSIAVDGNLTAVQKFDDGGFVVAGIDIVINGLDCKSELVFSDKDGNIDTSKIFKFYYSKLYHSPDELFPGAVTSMEIIGDTLFVAGQFTTINDESHYGVAAFSISNQELLKWHFDCNFSNNSYVFKTDKNLFISGGFSSVDGIYTGALAILDMDSFKIVSNQGTSHRVHLARNGEGNTYMKPEQNRIFYGTNCPGLALTSGFNFDNVRPLPGNSFLSSFTSIEDDSGGYFVGGHVSVSGYFDGAVVHVNHNDSVTNLNLKNNFSDVYHLQLFNDTLLIIGNAPGANNDAQYFNVKTWKQIEIPFQLKLQENGKDSKVKLFDERYLYVNNATQINNKEINASLRIDVATGEWKWLPPSTDFEVVVDTFYALSEDSWFQWFYYETGSVARFKSGDSIPQLDSRINRTTRALVSDGKGGYYAAGLYLKNNIVIHINMDGSLDTSFHLKMTELSQINCLLRKGDTLIIGGHYGYKHPGQYSGILIFMDLKTKKQIPTPNINFDGGVKKLVVFNDTLLVAGSYFRTGGSNTYRYFSAVDLKQMSHINWSMGSFNKSVADVAVDDDYIYLVGEFNGFDTIDVKHIARLRRSDFSLDTSFRFKIDYKTFNSYPTFHAIKIKNNRLFVAGFGNDAKISDTLFHGLFSIDLSDFSIKSYSNLFNYRAEVHDVQFMNDTMYLVGKFANPQGRHNFLGFDFNNNKVLKYLPIPEVDGEPLNIVVENNNLFVMGEFMKIGRFKGDYAKFNIHSREFMKSPDNDLNRLKVFGIDLTLIDKNLFVLVENKYKKRYINRYDLKNDESVYWICEFLNDHRDFEPTGIYNYRDSLIVKGTNYVAKDTTKPLGHSSSEHLLLLETKNGKLCNSSNFNGEIAQVQSYKDRLRINGSFRTINSVYSSLIKIDNSTFEAAPKFLNSTDIVDFKLSEKQIWADYGYGISTIDYNTGEEKRVFSLVNQGGKINHLFAKDSFLYVLGDISRIDTSSDGTYKILEFDTIGSLSLNAHSAKLEMVPFSFAPKVPKLIQFGNETQAFTFGFSGSYLHQASDKSLVTLYDRKTEIYSGLDLGDVLEYNQTDIFSEIKDDKLYLANAYMDIEGVREYGLFEIDLKNPTNIVHIHDEKTSSILFAKGKIYVENGTRIKAYSLTDYSVYYTSLPIPGKVNDMVFHDTSFYIGGSKGLNVRRPGPLPWGYKSLVNGSVNDLEISGNYLLVSGRIFDDNWELYKNFEILELPSGNPYRFTPLITEHTVVNARLHKNLLFITMEEFLPNWDKQLTTRVYDFFTGQEVEYLRDLGLRADQFLFTDEGIWIGGEQRNVTEKARDYLAYIQGDIFDWKVRVRDYFPKEIVRSQKSKMIISGSGFTSETTFWLQNSLDTIIPLDTTISQGNTGTVLKGELSPGSEKTGLYDLIIDVLGDTTVVIPNAIRVVEPKFGNIDLRIVGDEAIRAQRWSGYNIALKNNANFNYYNVPVFIAFKNIAAIKIREFISTGSVINFDKQPVLIPLDSLNNRPFDGHLVGLIIPEILANTTRNISFAIKAKNTENREVEIHAFNHGPLSHTLFQDSTTQVYANLFGVSPKCIESSIEELTSKYFNIAKYSETQKTPIYDFKTWVEEVENNCEDSIDVKVVMSKLVPSIAIELDSFSDDRDTMDNYNGKLPIIDIVKDSLDILIVGSYDPNIKIGYKGHGDANHTSTIPKELDYTIHFENDSTATASVQTLIITDSLDLAAFDPKSVVFNELSLSDDIVQFPTWVKEVDNIYTLDKKASFVVHVKATVDTITGVLTCEARAIDKLTRSQDDIGVYDGFLPPNRGGKNGNGYLRFSIQRRDSLSELKNKASIIFDINKPIVTPTWTITEDITAPTSTLTGFVSSTNKSIELNWSGEDLMGAGIRDYNTYYSKDNINYKPLLKNTVLEVDTFIAEERTTYFFYSIATDNAGNVETKNDYDLVLTTGKDIIVNGIDERIDNLITVFPNPSTGEFTFSFEGGNRNLKVYDAQGKVVTNKMISNGDKIKIEMTGIYSVLITDDNKDIQRLKLVVY